MPAFRVWALMPIGNPKSMQAWDGVKYLGQLYAYAETSQRARELAAKRFSGSSRASPWLSPELVEIMRVLDIGDPPPFESVFAGTTRWRPMRLLAPTRPGSDA
jgi:hypothetical protein